MTKKMISKSIRFFSTALLLFCLMITGCSIQMPDNETELIKSVPEMDITAFNRFQFSMRVTAADADTGTKEFFMGGVLEINENVSHMKNTKIKMPDSKNVMTVNAWSDFSSKMRYMDTGDGWYQEDIRDQDTPGNLADIINGRDTKISAAHDENTSTLSWEFPVKECGLFDLIMSESGFQTDFDGSGRVSAVLDQRTHELLYFSFIISANNAENVTILLDSVFLWDAVNEDEKIMIPDDISCDIYETDTGVATNGGYDDRVNPMAEDFIRNCGGTAEVTNTDATSSMFWTKADEAASVTINYIKTGQPLPVYDENYRFLSSFYGEPVQEDDSSSYFYDSPLGELHYLAFCDDWYVEITVAESGLSDGELRKSLIKYLARLEI